MHFIGHVVSWSESWVARALQLTIISSLPTVCYKNIIWYKQIWKQWPRILPSNFSTSPYTINFCSMKGFPHYLRFCPSEISFPLVLFISAITHFCNFVAFDIIPNVWFLKLEKLNLNPTWGLWSLVSFLWESVVTSVKWGKYHLPHYFRNTYWMHVLC